MNSINYLFKTKQMTIGCAIKKKWKALFPFLNNLRVELSSCRFVVFAAMLFGTCSYSAYCFTGLSCLQEKGVNSTDRLSQQIVDSVITGFFTEMTQSLNSQGKFSYSGLGTMSVSKKDVSFAFCPFLPGYVFAGGRVALFSNQPRALSTMCLITPTIKMNSVIFQKAKRMPKPASL